MRLARTLLTVIGISLMALALNAGSATARVTLEVIDENEVHCDPCVLHIVGEQRIVITANPAIVIARCEDEFIAEIYEDGTGHITLVNKANHGGGNCTVRQCNGVGEAPSEVEWEFAMEETAANQAELATTFCLDTAANPNATGSHCAADVGVTEPTTHNYRFQLNQACPSGTTVVGDWSIEGSPIEIEHQ